MTQVRGRHARHRPRRHGLGLGLGIGVATLLGLLLLVGAACSSSGSKPSAGASTSSTGSTGSRAKAPAADQAAVARGIALVVAPGDGSSSSTPPADFLSCSAAKLSGADQVTLAKIKSSDAVPADVGVRVIRAGRACNGDYLVSAFKSQIGQGDGAIPGISGAQASCVASKTVAAIAALDDKTIGSGPGNVETEGAIESALSSCYPVKAFIDAQLRQGDPQITGAELSCIHGKVSNPSWKTVLSSSSQFSDQLEKATKACGVGG